ncbi:MAG: phosphatidylglycerophosphatase A [Rhodobacteraceae bacterium]|nr:phosphatidylglycerophosphatase A [Paracoccaceae bacterium]
MSKLIATVFGIGYINPGSGTWGSLVALPFFWVIYQLVGVLGAVLVCAMLFYIGWKATEIHSNQTQTHDASEIVIDEVVGQFIALLPVALGAYMTRSPIEHLWPAWISAFLIFRGLDILKPGIIGSIDKDETALSVMLDDVFAGFFAACGVCVLAGIFHVIS